jgi:uncharacterized protein YkwD
MSENDGAIVRAKWVVRMILIFMMTLFMITAPVSAVDKHRSSSMSSYHEELLGLINRYRTDNHLKPLHSDAKLTALAHSHSTYMHQRDDLSHDGFSERFKNSGSSTCIENVGWNYKTAGEQFAAWRKSSGHDRNMLSNDIRRAGISRVGSYVTFLACR